MNYLKMIWDYLNGKKTGLFSFVLVVYYFAVAHNFVTYDQSVVDVLQLLVAGGLTHKAVKYVQETS